MPNNLIVYKTKGIHFFKFSTILKSTTNGYLNYYNLNKINYFFSFLEYVQLYVDFLLNKSIYKQFAAFYYGFHSVCASYALLVRMKENITSVSNM